MPTAARTRRPRRGTPRPADDRRIARLSKLSVGRGSDAYADVAWDEPQMAIAPDDGRMTVPSFDPLAQSDWYRSLPAAEQARVASWKLSAMLRIGADFENLLQQGLLSRALHLPAGEVEFRYLHHEVIEESQHSLMFLELVNRLGVGAKGMPWGLRNLIESTVPWLARHRPHVFFMLVLAGEDPVDRYQRQAIAEGIEHPLVERIMKIHVAEEARHVSFASLSLERHVAGLSRAERRLFALTAPIALGIAARLMLMPPRSMAGALDVRHRTITDPYRTPEGKAFLADSLQHPRKVLSELGLCGRSARRVWRAMGIWPA